MIMELLGIRYDNLMIREALDKAILFLSTKKRSTLLFLNADCLFKSQNDTEYAEILRKADLVLPDGIGMRVATALAGGRMKENCNGTDFTPLLIQEAAKLGKAFFFMGSEEGVAKKAASELEKKIEGIRIVGTSSGFFKTDEEIVGVINHSHADILLVGMGAPRQEKWIYRNYDKLNVSMCVGVGALFEWLSGYRLRAPKLFRKLHAEWVWRILIDPVRLARRYLVDDPKIFWSVLRQRFFNKP